MKRKCVKLFGMMALSAVLCMPVSLGAVSANAAEISPASELAAQETETSSGANTDAALQATETQAAKDDMNQTDTDKSNTDQKIKETQPLPIVAGSSFTEPSEQTADTSSMEDSASAEKKNAATDEDAVNTTSIDIRAAKKENILRQPAAGGLDISATNFPDSVFRTYISDNYDTNGDGKLSDEEIQAVTNMYVDGKDISDLTGIKYFTSLKILYAYDNLLTSLDVSGMQNLTIVHYSDNPFLKTLDFRNCPNLKVGYHSYNGETVYISAGMTKYIGCDAIPEHTGNVVIDLEGYYTTTPDGTKTVDLSKVVSPTFLSVLAENQNTNYDPATTTLTIPANEAKTTVTAGEDGNGNSTHWTFYTKITKVDDVTVTFDSRGGSNVEAQVIRKGSPATAPTDPTQDGAHFDGWYTDKECTQKYDFSSPVNADITLYAKWTTILPEVKNYTVTFDSKGGSAVDSQTVKDNSSASRPADPTRNGYTLDGWFSDESFQMTYDFSSPVHSDLTLYAKWTAITYTVSFNSEGGTSIESQTVSYQNAAVKPADPVRSGYSFKGWYLDESYGASYDFSKKVTANVVLYAKWEKMLNLAETKASSPAAGTLSKNAPVTGDTSNIVMYGFTMVASLLGVAFLLVSRKRREK